MITEVLFFINLLIEFCIFCSVKLSKAEVASSNKSIGAFFNIALAIAILNINN